MKVFMFDGWYGSICTEENTSQGTIHYGKLLLIGDSITYESPNREDLYEQFVLAIEDYVDFCKEVGKIPDKVVLIEENVF